MAENVQNEDSWMNIKMSELKTLERMKFEKLFGMGSGYVLDFSNITFQEFVLENVNIDIFDDKYNLRSGSKANRLRAFWNEESNSLVAALNLSLLEYWKTKKQMNDEPISPNEQQLFSECMKIVNRFGVKQTSAQRENVDGLQSINQNELDELKAELYSLSEISPQARGFAFEKFLNMLFSVHGLAPRGSFRLIGEQIDGSFQLDAITYLVEAKWQEKQVGNSQLLAFKGKVASKADWSRGIFISYSGFTAEGLAAFSKAGSTNIIGMTGQDIHFILEGEMSFIEAILYKSRRAAETGEFWVSVYELCRGY